MFDLFARIWICLNYLIFTPLAQRQEAKLRQQCLELYQSIAHEDYPKFQTLSTNEKLQEFIEQQTKTQKAQEPEQQVEESTFPFTPVSFAIENKKFLQCAALLRAGHSATHSDLQQAMLHKELMSNDIRKEQASDCISEIQKYLHERLGIVPKRGGIQQLIEQLKLPEYKLMQAIQNHDVPEMLVLMHQGANVNKRINGTNPLEMAISHGNKVAVERLLASGAVITERDVKKAEAYLEIYATNLHEADIIYPGKQDQRFAKIEDYTNAKKISELLTREWRIRLSRKEKAANQTPSPASPDRLSPNARTHTMSYNPAPSAQSKESSLPPINPRAQRK